MQDIICYKISNGSIYEDKQRAEEEEAKLNQKEVLDHTQNVPLKFEVGSTVYIAHRDKIRECKVKEIGIDKDYYEDNIDQLQTYIYLSDNYNEYTYWTSKYDRDLNTQIVTNFLDLCDFDYTKFI